MKKTILRTLITISIVIMCFSKLATAATFTIPEGNNSLLGKVEFVSANRNDTLLSIAQNYNLGLNAIVDANPDMNPIARLQGGDSVEVPNSFLLPNLPHKGIVINLPEMRMYYYPSTDSKVVMTYPIGIGKIGKTIPIVRTWITHKKEHPIWIPTPAIRAFNETQGISLPEVMQPGPDNPLGPYAIYLDIPTFLIHSTIFPDSVGRRASFGCIRMHESDIKEFFPLVQPRVPVTIVDMPNKLGWHDNTLFLETHDPLEERKNAPYAGLNGIVSGIESITHGKKTLVNWEMVARIEEDRDGMPHEIGINLN